MGTASSHEIRQIVDEAIFALRSGKQQQQSFCRHQRRAVTALDDDNGVLLNKENVDGVGCYNPSDDGVWESDHNSDSDGPVFWEYCCSDCEWNECCYDTVGCFGSEKGRACGLRQEKYGVEKKKEKRCKKCEKKQKCRKCRTKGPSFWSRCYPVKRRGDWGGNVVGVSRCPGEQDPKKWGFKVDNCYDHSMPTGVAAGYVCGGAGSCVDLPLSSVGTGQRHVTSCRKKRKTHDKILGDMNELHPQRGRRRTLLFDEFEAFPRGRSGRGDLEHRYRYHERGGSVGKIWRRRRRDEGIDGGLFAMHGALGDDERQKGSRSGGGGGFGAEDRGNRRRTRSWERRSDLDERIGEIDDRSEGSSYAIGERGRMAVSRREDGGRRFVRFERA